MSGPVFGMALDTAKRGFFDRKSVLNAMDKVTVKVLSRFGAYTMTTARGLIRRPGKKGLPSKPGKPPKNVTGLLRDFIFFSYEKNNRSVVIGPTRLNARRSGTPERLEYGGTTVVGHGKRAHRVFIAARPYMQPAFEKNQPKLPALWRTARAAA